MRLAFSRLDAYLLLMVVIWGSNFSVVKAAMREIPELAFNALRMAIASALFAAAIAWRHGLRESAARFTRRDWLAIVGLALVGHFFYQLLFMGGVARTSVANAALIFGCTPVAVALLSSAAGHERIDWGQWAGTLISVLGVYLVVARAPDSGASFTGDLMVFGAMISWALYTVGSRPLLERHSPLVVTGYTMAIGSAAYALLGVRALLRLDPSRVSTGAWAGLVLSAILALFAAYLIWYTAVQRVGGAYTAIYSNLTPIVAMAIAATVLGEPLTPAKLLGAAAVVSGVAMTRIRPAVPPEG
jgi:drug/metabolite transporter (DMT)-like permease